MTRFRPLHAVGEHPADQLRFLVERVDAGARVALVTIVGIVDTASRNVGTHMVVDESGRYAGSVSSGCIDGSVADFAIDALAQRESRRIRLGTGSQFIDLKLPCGGGVDLLIVPDPDVEAIRSVVTALDARQPALLSLTEDGIRHLVGAPADPVGSTVRYEPKLRLALAGRGAELTVFCRLAVAGGFDVRAFSPDETDVETCVALGARGQHLLSTSASPDLRADEWTAVVTLFHDHDWEPTILHAALASDAFYIGALGSQRTHANRLEVLERDGASPVELSRIRGPIGLVPSMRNATMLAISTLAEIAGQKRTKELENRS